MDSRRLLRSSALAVATAGLLASGCSSGSSSTTATASTTSAAGAQTSAALRTYYQQKLTWRACGVPGFECSTMKAPLDYAEPAGTSVKLAVARKKATGPGKRIGSLLVNPGGPGGTAVGYLQQYAGLGYPPRSGRGTTWWPSTRAGWPAASPSNA